jgi:catechol 2,3-dioxygenase-like lactoylglutathione lyase family enzyme
MTAPSALRPAQLHHVAIASEQPAALADFYGKVLDSPAREIAPGRWDVRGAERRLLIERGPKNTLHYAGYAFPDPARLARYRDEIAAKGINSRPSPTPLFADGAFAVELPDGPQFVFGVPREKAPTPDRMSGRIQHVVIASDRVPDMVAFAERLGFLVSDRVFDGERDQTAVFLRSDAEHHSFAVFRARARRLDHYAFETKSWNDIRDWADHLASHNIPVGWGPGRHGPGNNLFFMLSDPDGNALEFSAEIERLSEDQPTREWPHEQRTLNLWGSAWMRS